MIRGWIRNHPTSPFLRGHGMLRRDNRHCVHFTTLRSDAVGQTENQQRSTRAHRRSRTRATDIRTRIWNIGRQITSAHRRRRLENSNTTV